MNLKTRYGFLSLFLIVGMAFTSSDAWSSKQKLVISAHKKTFSLSEIIVPEEIWIQIFFNFHPFDLVSIGNVCHSWNKASNNLELWQHITGKRHLSQESKEYNDALNALKDLFETIPVLKQRYRIDFENIIKPTTLSYKYFFMSQYFESLSERLRDVPTVNKVVIVNHDASSKKYKNLACEQGFPTGPLSSFSQYSILTSALFGSSKYQAVTIKLMTNVQIDPNAKAQGAIERLKMAWPERRTELFNARTLEAIADNKPQLEETLKKFPNSGDVLAKLCKIMIDEIPANAPFDDPVARNFLHFFDHAFKCLTFKHGYLPAGIISAPCRRKGLGVDVNQRVKKAVDLIDVLGVYLNKKGDPWFKTRVLFLDRVMETPHYLYGDGWVQDTISKYLSSNEEWGRSVFLGTVTLLKCEDRWQSRDIRYLFEYVDFSNEPFQDMIRGSYKFLMGISLKRNDEQNFVRAFKGFSQNLIIDIKNGRTSYKMEYKDLESKEKAFMKKFPKNKEVPELFEKIPNPYPAKVRNRRSNCDHELPI